LACSESPLKIPPAILSGHYQQIWDLVADPVCPVSGEKTLSAYDQGYPILKRFAMVSWNWKYGGASNNRPEFRQAH
jgi:hypothetical protein